MMEEKSLSFEMRDAKNIAFLPLHRMQNEGKVHKKGMGNPIISQTEEHEICAKKVYCGRRFLWSMQ